jgi:mycofactocin system FadH/OYE family oxidoreductase 2
MFDSLFNSIHLGRLTLPNRVCFLCHRTNFAKKGRITDRHVAYYRRRAMGGCGLIIVGEFSIHPNDRPWEAMIETHDSGVVKDFQSLTNAIHAFDTKVFANLNHYGFQSSGAITRQACIAPSAVSDIAFGEVPKTMEQSDIKTVTTAFVQSAVRAQEGGFDGIEIDMGHQSILRQFLSDLSNFRQDEYGGSIENRMRLPLVVLNEVKNNVDKDFPIGIRLCADEMFYGAITSEESCEIAKKFEETGKVDFINVSIGTYYNLHMQSASMHTHAGFALETTQQIKEAVHIPVIGGYQINSPQMANEIIEKKQTDAIGFIRDLICDPDMPQKARNGKIDSIRNCVRDNNGCIGRINQSKILGCIQNPEVGYEYEAEPDMPKRLKKVWIIGAGPAGLKAAITAKLRGHDVRIFEKNKTSGGQINLQVKGAGRQGMGEVIRHLEYMLHKLNITIINNKKVTADYIKDNNPEVVVVATGATPVKKPVPGEYDTPFVQSVPDILENRYPVGNKILFVDENGGHHATATVEILADQGKKIDMVTPDLFIGVELAPIGDLYLTRQRLLQKGVTFTTDVRVEKIENQTVYAKHIFSNQYIKYEGYDTIVLDMGEEAEELLYYQLKGHVEIYRIGDCVAPRGIDMAIFEGRKVGEAI